jgi:hypothetical protein
MKKKSEAGDYLKQFVPDISVLFDLHTDGAKE